MGYLFANFGLPKPLCSRLRPDVRDRHTDVRQTKASLNAPPIRGGGITSCRRAAATILCPRPGLQVVTRYIRHVRIWIGRPYCMSRLACQYYQQSGLVTLTFDLESGVRVTCDVGYLCANVSLPRPVCSRVTTPPPSVWPHLFCGAGHEKRRGQQLKWSLACRLYIVSFPCAQLPGPVHTARLGRVSLLCI